jgi:enterochelin esterase family protein
MKYLFFVLITLCACTSSCKKEELLNPETEELTVLEKIDSIVSLENDEERQLATSSFWNSLKNENNIPFTKDSLAIFFYYGEANTVKWNGDFNSWTQDATYDSKGVNIEGTDLWYWSAVFPEDARLDYKITLNGSNWILDPENQYQQWSGFGPNSELRMPKYETENMLTPNPNIETGSTETFTIYSDQLNYQVAIKVYLPTHYENANSLPVIIVTDGHEYSDERLGNMITVLDNLIAEDKIEPIIAAFIDPRDPDNLGINRRQDEYTINANYLDFVTGELVPRLETQFKAAAEPDKRAILGTSLGGINSSYFGARANQYFKNIASQSPAYWYRSNEIYDLVEQAEHSETKIFMSAGTFNDGLENALKMKEIYETKGLATEMMTVNEGHSWGAWSAQLDDILIYFYGNE